jgi:hypothetical protein
MIIKKTWRKKHFGGKERYVYTGWFLFGIVPLYIIRTSIDH